MQARAGDSKAAVLMLRMVLGAVLVFMAAPILIVVANSFNSSQFNVWPPAGFTLDWYHKALTMPQFQRGFVNSVIAGVLSTLVVLAVGTPLAYAIVRIKFRGKSLLQGVLLGPLVVPRIAMGFSLFVLYLASGSGLYGSMSGIVLGHALLMLPFVVSVLVANLGEVDPIVEEAARDLGAGAVEAFVRVVLPQIRPGLIVAGLLAFITSFDEVETTIFLVKPVVNTLPIEMYLYLDQYQDPTLAALSTLLIALSMLLVLVGLMFAKRGSLRFLLGGRGA
ncbi:ABC transporter permease [Aliirhizobium smilacinae]|uniref:ABC transporter permease n=1 Tax=Aliirhizobium smilacinae TaxID=1395944 RepID=A0A5C4XJ07_9HYPH|nr:ABC transporter permease [Rhizobium smilacinae]TNM63453.1 ABC transporter permease [Rhizobium smilacinae]